MVIGGVYFVAKAPEEETGEEPEFAEVESSESQLKLYPQGHLVQRSATDIFNLKKRECYSGQTSEKIKKVI